MESPDDRASWVSVITVSARDVPASARGTGSDAVFSTALGECGAAAVVVARAAWSAITGQDRASVGITGWRRIRVEVAAGAMAAGLHSRSCGN